MFEPREFQGTWNALGQNYCKVCHTFFPIGAQFGNGKHAVVDRFKQSTYVICNECYIRIIVEGTQQEERSTARKEVDKIQQFGNTKQDKKTSPKRRAVDYSTTVRQYKKKGIKLWADSEVN